MASGKQSKEYSLAVKIAGKIDPSLGAAVSKAQSTLSKLGGFAGTMAKAAGIAITAATGAATAFAKSAVDAGMQFDSAMSQVAATMGTTVDQIDQLRDFAMEMGAKTMFSASEAAEGLNILAMAGLEAKDQLATLPQVLDLAAAGGLSLEDSANYVTGAVKGFSDSMDNAKYYSDLMAKGATLAKTDVGALGEAITRGAATAAAYGQSADSMTLSLLRLADQNVTGEAAATALNRAMSDLYSPTSAASKALTELGVSAYDKVTGKARDFTDVVSDLNSALSSMTQGLSAFNKITATSADALQKFRDGLADSSGAAAMQAAEQMNNLAGDVKYFKSALEGAQITLSDQLTPTLRQFVQFGTSGITQLSDAFKEGGLSGAMEAFGSILSDGLNMVIAALPEMVDAGMQLLGALGEGIMANLPAILDALLQVALMAVDGIIEAFPRLLEAGVQIVTMLALGIADALPELIPSVVEAILQIVETLTSPESFEQLLAAALAIIEALGRGLIDALPRLISAVANIDSGIINALTSAIPLIIETGIELFVALVANLPAIIAGIIQAIPQIIMAILNAFGTLQDDLAGVFSGAWEAIKEIFAPVGEFFSGVWSGIKGAFGAVADWFSGVFTDAWTAVKDVFSKGGEIFTGIVDGILDGFKVVVNGIIGGLNAVIKVPFDGINTALRTIRDINILGVTPFSWITEIGVPQIPMLAEGGVVNQATTLIAGEAGSEAIVPLSELWAQLQDMISDSIGGASDRIADLLAELDGGDDDNDGWPEPQSGDAPMFHITYNPEYHFEGAAPSRDDLVEAERMSQDEFNRKMEQWQKDNARKRF